MKKFEYQIVRYIHDRVTSEFVNVGIIVFQKETRFLQGRFISRYSRISKFFHEVNGTNLLSSLRQFDHQLKIEAFGLNELFSDYQTLTDITNTILQPDDSSIICSELFVGIDINPLIALEDLFERMVNKYFEEEASELHNDEWVWKKLYKRHFDQQGITKFLKPYTIETDFDRLEFTNAWKNGVWNVFQPISFDLKRTDTLKNKVYKWSGKLSAIEKTNNPLNIYFLSKKPAAQKNITDFIYQTLLKDRKQNLKVNLINEDEAEHFVSKFKDQIESSITQ